MLEEFERSELLLGKEYIDKLINKKVIIFGLGGVGSFLTEILVRAGIFNITLVDKDIVNRSNINRQLIATNSTLGKYKVDVMKERMLDINNKINIKTYKEFYLPSSKINLEEFDYIIDAMDTISSKIYLAEICYKKNIKIISAMGCGNRLDPTKFKIADIYETAICPICKIMRRELRKRNILNLKVVYSTEKPINIDIISKKEKIIGSVPFVPSVAGIIMASYIIKDLIKMN